MKSLQSGIYIIITIKIFISRIKWVTKYQILW
jgi:hypothetical protein